MPSDQDMSEERYHYMFIHNAFGHFFKDVSDYLSEHLYSRFNWTVIGTYDKAVEYIKKKEKLGREADKPNLPALILNPTGEFNTADASAGGRQLWRFPNLAPGLATRLFEPIYQDDNIEVNVCFSRFKGEIELIMLLNSFYEYCDVRVLFIQIFGGLERWIYPQWFTSFIVFEDEAYNYLYENEVTNESYKIDWESNGASSRLVKTTNRNEKVYPCRIKPTFRLSSLADGSERYGSTDNIAEWKLTATIEYEVEFPTFMTIQSDVLRPSSAPPPIFKLSCGSTYSKYENFGSLIPPEKDEIITGEHWKLQTRYFHKITSSEETQSDSTSNIEIELPEAVDQSELEQFILLSKYGVLEYGSHYILKNNGYTIEIITTETEGGSFVNRSKILIRELQPDGTYIPVWIAAQRFHKKIDGRFILNSAGNYVKDPKTSYSQTPDNRFVKDPNGEFVLRDNGVYEIRIESDYEELVQGTYSELKLKEGDFLEMYKYKKVT